MIHFYPTIWRKFWSDLHPYNNWMEYAYIPMLLNYYCDSRGWEQFAVANLKKVHVGSTAFWIYFGPLCTFHSLQVAAHETQSCTQRKAPSAVIGHGWIYMTKPFQRLFYIIVLEKSLNCPTSWGGQEGWCNQPNTPHPSQVSSWHNRTIPTNPKTETIAAYDMTK